MSFSLTFPQETNQNTTQSLSQFKSQRRFKHLSSEETSHEFRTHSSNKDISLRKHSRQDKLRDVQTQQYLSTETKLIAV